MEMFCNDCLCDIHSFGLRQYYMVKNEIWKSATNSEVKFLCVECLEKRIERSLVPNDFSQVILNFIVCVDARTSQKLKDRLGVKFSCVEDLKKIIDKFKTTKQYEKNPELYDEDHEKIFKLFEVSK